MATLLWHKVAAISGIAAIGAGTYEAHGFKPVDPVYKTVWQTTNLYHLVHTSALLAAPLTKRPNLFGSLLTFGIVAFSGTCYVVALNEDRKLSKPAPFGGLAFIAAWAWAWASLLSANPASWKSSYLEDDIALVPERWYIRFTTD